MSVDTIPTAPPDGSSDQDRADRRLRLRLPTARSLWVAAALVAPAMAMGIQAYRRRWIGDDGLIFVRVSEQILAGNGPNFNAGERVEAATSTVWPWMIAVIGGATGVELTSVAVYGSLFLSVAGLIVASDGARRLFQNARGGGWPLPAGALVIAALPPFWDFATSGLEMGLVFLWLGGCWALLTSLSRDTQPLAQSATAFVLGIGVLVRPDLALATVVFGVAAWLLLRPSLKRLLLLAFIGGSLPVAYQIFRMGYYGVLTPNTAIAKEGGDKEWDRGLVYFQDYAEPYKLWIPLVLAIAAVAVMVWYGRSDQGLRATRTGILVSSAVLTGVLLLGYVVMVGGDFMHGRLLLPGTFALLLPLMVLPMRPLHTLVAAGLAVWSAVCALTLRVPYKGFSPDMIEDTRSWYQSWTHDKNPVADDVYKAAFLGRLQGLRNTWVAMGRNSDAEFAYFTYYHSPSEFWMLNFDFRGAPLKYHVKVTDSMVYGALGQPAATVPTSGLVIDVFGLASPLGSHFELDYRTRSGHDKMTLPEWIVADFTAADAVLDMRNLDPAKVAAARKALTCGAIAELQRATREPMSFSRFWKNLTGAFDRTSLRIPTDPIRAQTKFCKH